MIDYTSVLKTTHNCLLDYTYATFNVNRSASISHPYFMVYMCQGTLSLNLGCGVHDTEKFGNVKIILVSRYPFNSSNRQAKGVALLTAID